MKALSVRQPWAWLLANGFKDVENRTRRFHHRGLFLIHASSGCSRTEYYNCVDFVRRCVDRPERVLADMPDYANLERGGVVGLAQLVDCVEASRSRWFTGPFGLGVSNASPVAFYQCKGALGLFEIPWPPARSVVVVGQTTFDGRAFHDSAYRVAPQNKLK